MTARMNRTRNWVARGLGFGTICGFIAAVVTLNPNAPTAAGQPPIPPLPQAIPSAISPQGVVPVIPSPSATFGQSQPIAPTPLPAPQMPAIPNIPLTPAMVRIDVNEIVEPIAEVHRLSGRFLHATSERVMYLDTELNRVGLPAIVSHSLKKPIPPLAVDEQFRTPVPAGDAQWCLDHVVVAGIREVVAVDIDGKVEWRFTLPGKPDARESLLGVIGNDGPKVLIASQFNDPDNKQEKPFGRVFGFDRITGRLIDCTTFAGGFHDVPLVDLSTKELFAFHGPELVCFDLISGQKMWSRPAPRDGIRTKVSGYPGGVLLAEHNLGSVTAQGWRILRHEINAAVPAAVRDGIVYAVGQMPGISFCVQAVESRVASPIWSRAMPSAINMMPVVTESSVYVVAGKVLYRLDRATGSICWKKTLPLNEGEEITEFKQHGNELWLSGFGVYVRVRNQSDPIPEAKPSFVPRPELPIPPPSAIP
jgi:hypothetical protein